MILNDFYQLHVHVRLTCVHVRVRVLYSQCTGCTRTFEYVVLRYFVLPHVANSSLQRCSYLASQSSQEDTSGRTKVPSKVARQVASTEVQILPEVRRQLLPVQQQPVRRYESTFVDSNLRTCTFSLILSKVPSKVLRVLRLESTSQSIYLSSQLVATRLSCQLVSQIASQSQLAS